MGFSYGPYRENEYIPKWKRSILNCNEIVNTKEHAELKTKHQYITPGHGIRAYLKEHVQDVNSKYKTEIDKSITKFRADNNYTTYLYDLDLRAKGLTLNPEYVFKYFTHKTPAGLILNSISNPQSYQVICINDTSDDVDEVREGIIDKHFAKTFPTKSKYEQ